MKKLSIVFFVGILFFSSGSASDVVVEKDDTKMLTIDATEGMVRIDENTFDNYKKLLEIVQENEKVSYKDGKVIIKPRSPLWLIIGTFLGGVICCGFGAFMGYGATLQEETLYKIGVPIVGALFGLCGVACMAQVFNLIKKRSGKEPLVELDDKGIFFDGTQPGVRGTYLTWEQVSDVIRMQDGVVEYLGIIPISRELITQHQSLLVQLLALFGKDLYYALRTTHLPISTLDFITMVEYFWNKKREVEFESNFE